jgi:glycosyltransferase involved in cell wall biosynthesis
VIRQVVDAATGSVFVPPGNAHALALAVLALSTNEQAVQTMGHNARQYVAKHFNRADQAQEFERLLAALTRLT